MGQKKSKQVLVRVTPDRKQEWEEAAEERGYGVSEFVRHAVDDVIEGRATSGTVDVDSEEITEAIEQSLAEHTEEVDRRLSAIEAALNGIQEELDAAGGEGTVAAELIFEGLPKVSPYTKDDEGKPREKPRDVIADQAKSPEEVAGDIGVPTAPVRRTLERLDLESERVLSVELDNGERRYFANV